MLAFRKLEASSDDTMVEVSPHLSLLLDMDLVPALKTLDSPLTAAAAAAEAAERDRLRDNVVGNDGDNDDNGDNGDSSVTGVSRPAGNTSL